jgi:hypothetical protein
MLLLITVTAKKKKKILPGRRLLFLLAGIGIPLCAVFFAVAGGNRPPMRSLFALPFASAFMLFFLIKTYKKKAAAVVACLTLIVAAYQAQISAQLFYSDQLRYNEDVRIAYDFNDLIIRVQPYNKKLPVVLVGKYQMAPRFHANFLQGEIVGFSMFETGGDPYQTTSRGLVFMSSLGFNFDLPDGKQMEQAFKEAVLMPPYPHPDCVKRLQDVIVIRISETLY